MNTLNATSTNMNNSNTSNATIYTQVAQKNRAYFEEHQFSQTSLNYGLECCGHFNSPLDLALKIIELGANNIAFVCCYAISNYNYQLPQNLLKHYREHHHRKINVFSDMRHDLTWDVSSIIENHNLFLPLVVMIIEGLPNHTQILCKTDKTYEEFENTTYASVYNNLLNHFVFGYIQATEAEKKQGNLTCIQALAKQHFPVYDENAYKIIDANLEDYFPRRLQGGKMPAPRGLAHRTILRRSVQRYFKPDRLKANLYYELADYFQVPGSITCHMLDCFHEEDNTKVLPNESQFEFFEQLHHGALSQNRNAQQFLAFLKRYYLIDKMKLERQLRMEIIDNYDDNKGNSYESHHGTIKI
jgi:hypothetical protein